MFCFCLLRLGLAVTGAPAENFGTRIHGVDKERYGHGWALSRQSEICSSFKVILRTDRQERIAVVKVQKKKGRNRGFVASVGRR